MLFFVDIRISILLLIINFDFIRTQVLDNSISKWSHASNLNASLTTSTTFENRPLEPYSSLNLNKTEIVSNRNIDGSEASTQRIVTSTSGNTSTTSAKPPLPRWYLLVLTNLRERSKMRATQWKAYMSVVSDLALVLSNIALLPAIYLALKAQLRAEAIVYAITMVSSALYHLCDNSHLQLCTLPYAQLQFLDFYSATLTLWCTALVLAPASYQWLSTYHLVGAIAYAALLHSATAGVLSFIVPAIGTSLLLGAHWGYLYYMERRLPSLFQETRFYVSLALITLGSLLFASQTVSWLRRFYGVTHSAWHICMGLAVTFLLPRYPTKSHFWCDSYRIEPQPEPPVKQSENDLTAHVQFKHSRQIDEPDEKPTSPSFVNPAFLTDHSIPV